MINNKTGQDIIDFIVNNNLEDKKYSVVKCDKSVYVYEEKMVEATILSLTSILASGHPGFTLVVDFPEDWSNDA